MTDRTEQITQLIASAESEAYARGYSDAIAAVTAAAIAARPASITDSQPLIDAIEPTATAQANRGRPATKAITLVRETVTGTPGLKGVEIFKALNTNGTPILERTMRSCLRRLRDSKVIWQRKGRWYPRPREAPLLELNGEASQTPPH